MIKLGVISCYNVKDSVENNAKTQRKTHNYSKQTERNLLLKKA